MSAPKFEVRSLLPVITIASSAVCITPYWNLEPIHLPRLFLASLLAAASVSILIFQNSKLSIGELKSSRNLHLVGILCVIAIVMFSTLIFNDVDIQRQVFGGQGRLNGLLANLFLILIFIAIAISPFNIKTRLWDFTFMFGGGFNLIYGYLQVYGLDPVNWQNPYGPVVGTMGNPNFMSSLLAFFGIYLLTVIIFRSEIGIPTRLIYLGLLLAVVNLIRETGSIQGYFVLLSALFITAAVKLRMEKNYKLLIGTLLIVPFISILLAVGLTGRGLLGEVLFQSTLKVRTYYWQAALQMIYERPLFGFGFDSYGDWYRSFRSREAATVHGPNLVTDSAHNILLDYGAFGGLPLLVSYLMLFIFVTFKAVKKLREDQPSWIFIFFFTGWIGYLLQAMISIQHLALSMWGMVFGGGLYALSTIKVPREIRVIPLKYRRLLSLLILFLFSFAAFLPFKKDHDFREALASNNGSNIIKVARELPSNDFYLTLASEILYRNGFTDLGRSLSRDALKINPRNYAALTLLLNDPGLNQNEQSRYKEARLLVDPYQP